MPTANRRAFVPHALRYFLQQDYPNRELVVVDDGRDPVEDLMPEDPRIRYLRLETVHSIGTKRNLACEAANGSLIVHWDDDDWAAPWRVRYQVEQLLERQAAVCGLANPLFYDPRADRAWQYVYPTGGKPWVYGATLCYTKAFWQNHPFPEISVGEDTRFVWNTPAEQVLVLPDNTFFVGLIHAENSSPKRTTGRRWQTVSTREIQRIWGTKDKAA